MLESSGTFALKRGDAVPYETDRVILRGFLTSRIYVAALKRLIVGTALGRSALTIRDFWESVVVGKEYLGTKSNDQLATHYVSRLCRPHHTFIDVGAHIGSTLAEVMFRCPDVKIVGIEAIPDKAKKLQAKFKNADILCYALSETAGPVSFFINETHSGYSSLYKNGSSVREIVVAGARLDHVVDAADVDVIKIDVEGAELGVLRGAEALIDRCRPTIMFESGPTNVLGYTKQAMFSWFSDRNYGVFLPNRLRHSAPPMSRELFLDSHEYPFRSLNYFAVAMERLDEVRRRSNCV